MVPTDFFDAKGRVIHMTPRGKYVVGTTYNPKAKYVRNPGGDGMFLLTSMSNLSSIPQAIRPKFARKVRSNKGAKRGPRK